ncbi:hypothetical protein [Chitinophaga eiseniae]|nr:hypothetical protein [Chitinophaga eiseniae]
MSHYGGLIRALLIKKGIADQQRFSSIRASLWARKEEKHLW